MSGILNDTFLKLSQTTLYSTFNDYPQEINCRSFNALSMERAEWSLIIQEITSRHELEEKSNKNTSLADMKPISR